MNVKVTVGYKSFVIANVNSAMVEAFLTLRSVDNGWRNGDTIDFYTDEAVRVEILKEMPTLSRDEYLSSKEDA